MHVHVFYMYTYKITEYLWQILKFDTQSRSVFLRSNFEICNGSSVRSIKKKYLVTLKFEKPAD